MTERPIIFSGDMVRAILDGRKTQTRRVVKPRYPNTPVVAMHGPVAVGHDLQRWTLDHETDMGITTETMPCPYGQAGDRLWVRETMRGEYSPARNRTCVAYQAGGQTTWGNADADWCGAQDWYTIAGTSQQATRWKPSIHMPRWASRLTLEITEVRVQRVQEISEEDAVAEGVDIWADFRPLWDSINAKRGFGWDANPWVWALTFKPVPPAGGTAG